jgi:uncharacterized membrane protein
VFDVVGVVTGGATWAQVSFYLIGAGLVGGVLAAIFGVVDLLAIPRSTRARRVGVAHGIGSVLMLALFAASFLLRLDAPLSPGTLAIGLSILGVVLSAIAGWLGAELVERLGVGVADRAGLDAPSSLTHLASIPEHLRTEVTRGPLGHSRANIDVPLLRGPRA